MCSKAVVELWFFLSGLLCTSGGGAKENGFVPIAVWGGGKDAFVGFFFFKGAGDPEFFFFAGHDVHKGHVECVREGAGEFSEVFEIPEVLDMQENVIERGSIFLLNLKGKG